MHWIKKNFQKFNLNNLVVLEIDSKIFFIYSNNINRYISSRVSAKLLNITQMNTNKHKTQLNLITQALNIRKKSL